eukprot:scaffold5882_cov100-Cylindrotheca_fusiformis.AAC.1
MATDIVDKELQALRKARWETLFSESTLIDPSGETEESETDRVNLKATIVIEYVIQASDVAHTMQHWHVYKPWNEKFFLECYRTYHKGRADSDPSQDWYKGEIGFFDFYVLPLAKTSLSCGVFGVSSDEYLNYAEANREEWVREGQDLVEQYLAKVSPPTSTSGFLISILFSSFLVSESLCLLTLKPAITTAGNMLFIFRLVRLRRAKLTVDPLNKCNGDAFLTKQCRTGLGYADDAR